MLHVSVTNRVRPRDYNKLRIAVAARAPVIDHTQRRGRILDIRNLRNDNSNVLGGKLRDGRQLGTSPHTHINLVSWP